MELHYLALAGWKLLQRHMEELGTLADLEGHEVGGHHAVVVAQQLDQVLGREFVEVGIVAEVHVVDDGQAAIY